MSYVKETALIGGRFKLGLAGGRKPTDFVGLVSSAQESIETSELRLNDTTNPLGGVYDSLAKIERFTLSINFREINARNLANLLYADVSEVPSTTVTEEEIVVGVGQTTALSKMPLTVSKVVDEATGLVEFDEGVDWRMTGAGIEVIAGSALATAITGAVGEYSVLVDYTSANHSAIEMITNSGKEWYLLFEGSNAVGTQGRVNQHYWRVKFQPAENRDVIGNEDFMGMQATCEVLRDDSRATGPTKSAYGRMDKESPAAP